MTNRPAVLAQPGVSTTSLLANLANIMDLSDNRTPVILIDKYDYERLRGRHIKGIGDNQKAPYLGMVYDELERRGTVHFIDYSKYYPKNVQEKYLQQNQKLIEEMPEWLHRQMAVKGVDLWKLFGRGTYQEPTRAALGEDPDSFATSRRKEEGLHQQLKRGRGDPVTWNRKLLNKSVAALEIRHQANKDLRLDVECVVGGPEHEIVTDLLNAARSNNSTNLETNVLDIDPGDITTEIPHSKESDPLHSIQGIHPEMNADTRNMFDTITNVATDIVGRGGDKWVLLGTDFAIPQYSEIFDDNIIRAQINGGVNTDDLSKQIIQVLNTIGDTEESDPSSLMSYEADKMIEEHGNSTAIHREDLESILHQMTTISDYSSELDSLIDSNEVSQAAIFAAAGILSDPIHRYDENDIYRYSLDLAARFDLSGVGKNELERVGMEASGTTWGSSFDWVDDVDQRP